MTREAENWSQDGTLSSPIRQHDRAEAERMMERMTHPNHRRKRRYVMERVGVKVAHPMDRARMGRVGMLPRESRIGWATDILKDRVG